RVRASARSRGERAAAADDTERSAARAAARGRRGGRIVQDGIPGGGGAICVLCRNQAFRQGCFFLTGGSPGPGAAFGEIFGKRWRFRPVPPSIPGLAARLAEKG